MTKFQERASGLTQRQNEVMSLLSVGLSNREIGVRLGVSEQAVKAIVSRLLAKFHVRNRAGLVRAAIAAATERAGMAGLPVGDLAEAAIVLFDQQGHVLLMNDRGAQLAASYMPGQSIEQQMADWTVRDVNGAPIAPRDTPLGRALAGETVLDARLLVRRPGQGSDTLLQTNVSPLRDSSGQINGAISLFWQLPKTTA